MVLCILVFWELYPICTIHWINDVREQAHAARMLLAGGERADLLKEARTEKKEKEAVRTRFLPEMR